MLKDCSKEVRQFPFHTPFLPSLTHSVCSAPTHFLITAFNIFLLQNFKDQKSCDVKKHLKQLNEKIGLRIEPVFTSRKLSTQFGAKEKKHTIVNRQNVVYSFKCDLCEAGYVGYTCRHLYQRVEEHKSSAVGAHFKNCNKSLKHFDTNFTVLRQCKTRFDCLVYEMLFIKELKPSLNVQSDSLKAKLF